MNAPGDHAPDSRRPRRVLLAGATGYIGGAVARRLVASGFQVTALVRPGRVPDSRLDGCDVVAAEVTDPQDLGRGLDSVRADAVVSCLASRSGVAEDAWRVDHGANRHLLAAGERLGAGHFILLSALCVQKPRLAFQHAKLAFEKELRESPLAHTIVRPTAFFKSLAGQVERVRRGRPFLLFGDGRLTACKPISEQDLAEFLVDCLVRPDRRNAVLPIGGPGPAVTPREQGAWLFELAGRPPRFRSVPVGMFRAVEGVLAPLAGVSKAAERKAELARIGRYYATESMLCWDPGSGRYDEDATPEFGSLTLRDFYRRVWEEGTAGQEMGENRLFR